MNFSNRLQEKRMSGSQLITVTELNALLSNPKLVLLDIRYNLTDAAYGYSL